MALVKETRIREAANMEFRLEAFNTFNHTQLANPGTSGSDAAAARPGATKAQAAAAALGPGFGPITSTSVSPRVVQLALKFRF